jgi:hypothetical protein
MQCMIRATREMGSRKAGAEKTMDVELEVQRCDNWQWLSLSTSKFFRAYEMGSYMTARNEILLKLKDYPPTESFAQTRYSSWNKRYP